MLNTDDDFESWINAASVGSGVKSHEIVDGLFILVPFSIRLSLRTEDPYSIAGRRDMQEHIICIMQHAFPELEIVVDPSIAENFRLPLDAIPDYIGGIEVQDIIDSIIDECPSEWSKTKKVKYIKERIKEEFHLEGRKHPYWIQVPDWPAHNGKPMKYVKTVKKHKWEWHQVYFVDPETGDERIVDDID